MGGRRIQVELDAEAEAALELLMRDGATEADAVRAALRAAARTGRPLDPPGDDDDAFGHA